MEWITNAMFIIGTVSFVYGVGQISTPTAWIIAGLLLVGGSFVIAHKLRCQDNPGRNEDDGQ